MCQLWSLECGICQGIKISRDLCSWGKARKTTDAMEEETPRRGGLSARCSRDKAWSGRAAWESSGPGRGLPSGVPAVVPQPRPQPASVHLASPAHAPFTPGPSIVPLFFPAWLPFPAFHGRALCMPPSPSSGVSSMESPALSSAKTWHGASGPPPLSPWHAVLSSVTTCLPFGSAAGPPLTVNHSIPEAPYLERSQGATISPQTSAFGITCSTRPLGHVTGTRHGSGQTWQQKARLCLPMPLSLIWPKLLTHWRISPGSQQLLSWRPPTSWSVISA